MRIAYVSDTYLPETDGLAIAIGRHTRLLAERGHQVLVLCPTYEGAPAPPPGVEVIRYESWSAASNANTHVAVPALRDVRRRLRAFAPDLVHVHTPLTLGLCGIAAAKVLGIPLVQTYHTWLPGSLQYASPSRLLGLDRGPRRMHDSWLARAITHIVYDRSDLVLAPSETLCQMLRDIPVRPPVAYQTNGIDLTEFPPKEDWHTRQCVMHCGRMGFEKNIEVVVEAFALFSAEHPDWGLELLGEGPAEPYVRGLIERFGLGPVVLLHGFVDRVHLSRAYRDADFWVTASTIETQGLVILEAMASGTPVVGVDALAIPEMARDGVSGIIVQPYDVQGMAEAFRRMADDGALRERLGRNCIQEVQAHELHAAVERLERTYEELLAISPGRTRGRAWQEDTGNRRSPLSQQSSATSSSPSSSSSPRRSPALRR